MLRMKKKKCQLPQPPHTGRTLMLEECPREKEDGRNKDECGTSGAVAIA